MKFRTLIGALTGVVTTMVIVLGSTTVWSYFRTAQTMICDTTFDKTPVEFNLRRLTQMVGDLEPQIDKYRIELATAEVDCDRLESELTNGGARLAEMERDLLRQRDLLAAGNFCRGGEMLSREQFESDLATRLDNYNALESDLCVKEKLVDARRRSAVAIRKRIAGFKDKRQQLKVRAADLESRQHMLAAQERLSGFALDETVLTTASQLAAKLDRKLAIAEKMAIDNIDEPFLADVPRDVTSELDNKFGAIRDAAPPGVTQTEKPAPRAAAKPALPPRDQPTAHPRKVMDELSRKFGRPVAPNRRRFCRD